MVRSFRKWFSPARLCTSQCLPISPTRSIKASLAVEALERLNLNSPPHINGSLLSSPKALTPRDPVVSAKAVNQAKFQKVDIAKLEAQAEN